MKLNTGLTAFTLISSFCAGAGAGDSVKNKKVHLRGKATISDYANPTNPHNYAASANDDDNDCECFYCDCDAFPLHHEHESPTLLNLDADNDDDNFHWVWGGTISDYAEATNPHNSAASANDDDDCWSTFVGCV